MSIRDDIPFNPRNAAHLKELQLDAAGIFRDVLSAVHQTQPNLLSVDIRREWWSSGKTPSTSRVSRLLRNAAANQRLFMRRYGGTRDSIPDPQPNEISTLEDRVDELCELVITFADAEDLIRASRDFERGEQIRWASICDFTAVSPVRHLLRKLEKARERHPPTRAVKAFVISIDPPNKILHHGESIKVSHAKTWKALKTLVEATNRTVDVADFYESVWGAEWKANEISDDLWGAVHSLLKRIRAFLKEKRLPLKVSGSKKTLLVTIEENESPSDEVE